MSIQKFYKNLSKLIKHLSYRRKWQLVCLIFLMFVSALAEMATLGLVVPFLALLADPAVVDKYPNLKNIVFWFGKEEGSIVFAAGIIFCIITTIAAMIRLLMMWSSMRFSHGLGSDIGTEVYKRILHQPYSWHIVQNSSEILSVMDKVNIVVSGVLTPVMQGIVALIMCIGILVMLITIDMQTAFIAGVGFTVMYGITTLVFSKNLKTNTQIVSINMSRRVQAVQEGLGGIRDVLLDGTQSIYYNKFAGFDYSMRRAQASTAVIGASPRFIIEAAGIILIISLAYWLGPRHGGLINAIPILGALAIGAQKLLPQMQLIYASWSHINGSRDQLEDVLKFLSNPVESDVDYKSRKLKYIKDARSEKEIISSENKKIQIKLCDVSFGYKFDGPLVLKNINIEISRGSRVGLIGMTGVGKSTLIDLIMGLLKPTSGHIEIDGVVLDEFNSSDWQMRVAHVPQSIYLSDATIAENIAFGVPLKEIDFRRLKNASTKAQLKDFIENQKNEYQAFVGERGVRLSGGQRQRIGLARALYKQADILVLDEATSALDDLTERSIMSAIKELGNEVTVIMIAHRLSTLKDCDMVIHLADNSIINIGSYDSIIGNRAQFTE